MVELIIIFSPVWVILIVAIYDIINSSRDKIKYKKQRLMFNQLKKGDFIFKVSEDGVNIYKISSVNYKYDYKDSLESIEFISGYSRIKMLITYAKSFKYIDYYTIFEAANVKFEYIQSKKKKQLDKLQFTSNEEIASGVNKLIDELKDIENKIKND